MNISNLLGNSLSTVFRLFSFIYLFIFLYSFIDIIDGHILNNNNNYNKNYRKRIIFFSNSDVENNTFFT